MPTAHCSIAYFSTRIFKAIHWHPRCFVKTLVLRSVRDTVTQHTMLSILLFIEANGKYGYLFWDHVMFKSTQHYLRGHPQYSGSTPHLT